MRDHFAAQVAGISALAEPARRELYQYVVAQPDAVSRDEAAAAIGLPRHSAKFHLDRLVEEGLLETEFRRLSGRRGPGAGRPSKLYRRADRQVVVSLPERKYDLAGQILASALEETQAEDPQVPAAVARAAREAGQRVAAEAMAAGPMPERRETPLESLAALLGTQGYEPRLEGERVTLANCPFHDLSRQHTQLVCGMNREFIGALTAELRHDDVVVALDPGPDRCCVTLTRSS